MRHLVLFFVPDWNGPPAGVSNYYKRLMPHLYSLHEELEIKEMLLPVSSASGVISKFQQVMNWLLFIIRLIVVCLVKKPSLIVLNPSLTPFCLLKSIQDPRKIDPEPFKGMFWNRPRESIIFRSRFGTNAH